MHLHAIPPHTVQKSPPLNVQSYSYWYTTWGSCGGAIDVQKMNWEFRIGVDEQTGVCLQRHFGSTCTGGYTRASQNTGQCGDCQSITR